MIPCFSSHSVVAAHAGLVSMDPVDGTQALSGTTTAIAGHFALKHLSLCPPSLSRPLLCLFSTSRLALETSL